MGFNMPVFFLMYDGKLEVIYNEKWGKEKIREKCNGTCNSININFEIFSSEEHRIKKFQLNNPNPTPLTVKLNKCNSTALKLEMNNYHDGNKEYHVLKKPFKINDEIDLCQFCLVEINVYVKNEKSMKEVFYLEFLSNHSKSSDTFRIFGVYETINGSLLIPSSSNIRFNPGFPGIIQSKFVSIRSSFDIDCKVLEVESADPRIIPYIIKGIIPANSKEEFIKVVFDPSTLHQEYNVHKRNFH